MNKLRIIKHYERDIRWKVYSYYKVQELFKESWYVSSWNSLENASYKTQKEAEQHVENLKEFKPRDEVIKEYK